MACKHQIVIEVNPSIINDQRVKNAIDTLNVIINVVSNENEYKSNNQISTKLTNQQIEKVLDTFEKRLLEYNDSKENVIEVIDTIKKNKFDLMNKLIMQLTINNYDFIADFPNYKTIYECIAKIVLFQYYTNPSCEIDRILSNAVNGKIMDLPQKNKSQEYLYECCKKTITNIFNYIKTNNDQQTITTLILKIFKDHIDEIVNNIFSTLAPDDYLNCGVNFSNSLINIIVNYISNEIDAIEAFGVLTALLKQFNSETRPTQIPLLKDFNNGTEKAINFINKFINEIPTETNNHNIFDAANSNDLLNVAQTIKDIALSQDYKSLWKKSTETKNS